MTRKDYVAIAERFAEVNQRFMDSDVWVVLRAEMADVFLADNPRFDRDKFVRACGSE